MSAMPISASELLDAYDKSLLVNPKFSIRMVIWRMIYDEQQAAPVRDLLEKAGIFAKPETRTILKNQLKSIDRQRAAAEKSTGLPSRGKKGACDLYRQALHKWKKLNPRPTNQQLLAGWTPVPLEDAAGEHSAIGPASTSIVTSSGNEFLESPVSAAAALPSGHASELSQEYLGKAAEARQFLEMDDV